MQKLFSKLTSPTGICFFFILVTLLVSDYNFRWKNEKWKYAINSDGYDYYRYLPMVFIDNPRDRIQHEQPESIPVIKHYAGTAILFLPFFLLAYFFSFLFGFPIDGYSVFFQVFVSLGTLFYLFFGLYYLNKFLRFFLKSNWIIYLVLVSSVFATNIYYYSVIAPGWCHVLSFSMISFFLYHLKKIYNGYNKQSLFVLIVTLSFIFWTRPTDIVIIAVIPFFAGNIVVFKDTLRKIITDKKILILSCLAAFIPALCQLSMYKLQTGHFIIWSYTKEGFNFLNPEIMNVLFSYAKGLFVYTPICFLSLFGLIFLYKKNPFQFYGVFIYLIFNIYIISSWWCWNYGYCYGQRGFIDHYALFFFLLALLLDGLKNKWGRTILVTLIVICNLLNGVQMYQFENGILDNDYKTDKKGYWNVFLKTDGGYSGKYYRHPVDSSQSNIVKRVRYFNDMEQQDTTWINNNTRTSEKAYSGKNSSLVNQKACFSVGIKKKMIDIPYSKKVLIRVSGWFYLTQQDKDAFLIIAFDNNKGKVLSYSSFGLNKFMDGYNRWEYQSVEMYMPKLSSNKIVETDQDNQIAIYLYNNSATDCYVDDLSITFTVYKKMDRILDIWWDE